MLATMAKDFEKMTDEELAHFILSFPDNFSVPGALFEQQRRQASRTAEIERARHQEILRWTIVAAISAIIAAAAALWSIIR
jgi:hypothetical protein